MRWRWPRTLMRPGSPGPAPTMKTQGLFCMPPLSVPYFVQDRDGAPQNQIVRQAFPQLNRVDGIPLGPPPDLTRPVGRRHDGLHLQTIARLDRDGAERKLAPPAEGGDHRALGLEARSRPDIIDRPEHAADVVVVETGLDGDNALARRRDAVVVGDRDRNPRLVAEPLQAPDGEDER